MVGVTGKTSGVGSDIIDYLEAVGEYFDITIKVTSGYRDSKAQGQAMLDNWIKLERGKVYKTSALSEKNRKQLDEYYKTAIEDKKSNGKAKKKAESDFLALASTVKSMHAKGRAVDVSRSSVTAKAYKVLLMKLDEKKEGARADIYHLESDGKILAVTDKDKEKWSPSEKNGK